MILHNFTQDDAYYQYHYKLTLKSDWEFCTSFAAEALEQLDVTAVFTKDSSDASYTKTSVSNQDEIYKLPRQSEIAIRGQSKHYEQTDMWVRLYRGTDDLFLQVPPDAVERLVSQKKPPKQKMNRHLIPAGKNSISGCTCSTR